MRRFHVHLAVEDLDPNVAFYSKLFGQPPARLERDYAKWMLDDPKLNFAVSSRGHVTGVNHFGIQADSAQELSALKALARAASSDTTLDAGPTACCYAYSDKHWVVDPQGLAWEHFHTLSDAPTYGEDTTVPGNEACCIPLGADDAVQAECCVDKRRDRASGQCAR